jgi:hypothetical protein
MVELFFLNTMIHKSFAYSRKKNLDGQPLEAWCILLGIAMCEQQLQRVHGGTKVVLTEKLVFPTRVPLNSTGTTAESLKCKCA